MEDTIEQKKIEKQELHQSTEEYERRIIDLQAELESLNDDMKPIQRQIALIEKENKEFEETLRLNGTLDKVKQIEALKSENSQLEIKKNELQNK